MWFKLTVSLIFSSRSDVLSGSYLDRLPLELIISIFSHCEWRDVVSCRSVCRGFKDLVDTHEHGIVETMLKRLEGTNISLLSRLFPPPKSRLPSHGGARRPTLQYINTLEKRHITCSELAFFLAKDAVTPLFKNGSANLSRRDIDKHKEHAVRVIQRRLVRQMYHVEHFLVNTRLQLSAALTSLAAENNSDTPPTNALLAQIYREVQAAIIAMWPDTALISTHHAFHFLVNTIRLALSPDPPHNTNDDTVCIILRCPSPLQRCLEFFHADTPSAPSRLRRQFMIDMQDEKEKADLLAHVVFGGLDRKAGKRRGTGSAGESSWNPRVSEVWFEVARCEL
ncbi:hypothetical protein K440DRAFT_612203, partial [Wilcoxina mikolae CBS 423.85]